MTVLSEDYPTEQSTASILLDCLGYANEAAKTEQLARVTAEQWCKVVELAQQHGVAPLLYHHLKSAGLIAKERSTILSAHSAENFAEGLTAANIMELKQAFLENVARNMRFYQELKKLLRLFQEHDIKVIVLKGAYLAQAVYDNIGLRIMGDIDLLVQKDNLLRVEQDMLALGYEPVDCNRVITQENIHFRYTLPRNGLNVEIHWALVASNLPFQIVTEVLWSRAQPVILAEVPALTLSPMDLLLHLCLHTAKHIYDLRLRMFCDVGEVIQHFNAEIDWQEVGTRAEQWGITHAVYVILRLAQELLDVTVPADWLASLQPAGFDEHYLTLARQQVLGIRVNEGMGEHVQTARLWGQKRLNNKVAVICDSLFLSRESMAIMYPASVNSWQIYLYYLVRIKDMFIRHWITLWRLANGDLKIRTAAERINQITELHDWLFREEL
jgi:hypothetical protein